MNSKLTTKKAINEYFNREKIFKRLNNIAYFILGEDKKINFNLNIGGGSYTDGKNVTVGLPELFIGKDKTEIFLALKALVAHEISHVVDSDFSILSSFLEREAYKFESNYQIPKAVGKKIAHHVFNSIEDGRIERRVVNRLKGIKKPIQFLNLSFYEVGSVKYEETTDFLYNITSLSVIGLDTKGFKETYENSRTMEYINKIRPLIKDGIKQNTAYGCANICSQLLEVISPYIKELYKENKEFNNLNNTEEYSTSSPKNDDVNSTQSSHPFDDCDEKSSDSTGEETSDKEKTSNEGKSSNEEKNSDKGNSSEGEETQDEEKSSNEEETSDEGKSFDDEKTSDEGRPSNDEETSEKEIDRLLENLKNDALNECQKEIDSIDKSDKKDKEKIKEENEKKEKYSVNMLDILKINEKANIKAEFYDKRNNLKDSGKSLDSYDLKKCKVVRRELEKLLRNKNEFNYKFQKRGTLDSNSLWRIGLNKDDIFNKKQIPHVDDYVFYILLDSSGSMAYGEKTQEAFKSCAILEEVIKGLIPLKIVSFIASYSEVQHTVIKDFDEEKKLNYSLESNKLIRMNNGNNDAFSIKVASAELMKRPEKNKVLIMLSDGLPSVSTITGKPVEDVKKAVTEANKEGTKVFSVFFGEKAERERNAKVYRYMYKDNIINSDIKDISTNLMKLFKRTVFK